MNTKMVLAILGVAIVAAALIGVTAAQLVGAQNQTVTTYQTNPNCVNTATGEQICVNNGTCTNTYCNDTCTGVNCNNTCINANCNQTQAGNCNTGACQNQNQNCNQNNNCYAEQNQNLYGCGSGMMQRNSNGRGCHP